MTTFSGIFIPAHTIIDAKSKAYAADNLSGWQEAEGTAKDWIAKLEKGQTISLSKFTPKADGSFTHAVEYWQSTFWVWADGDNIKGVEKNTDGSEANPLGVDPWTEDHGLSERYKTLRNKAYAVGESVSSMSEDKGKPHRRYRLGFQTDYPIESAEHYHQILWHLC